MLLYTDTMVKIILFLLLGAVIIFAIYIVLLVIQTKQENAYDVDLHLPVGTQDEALIRRYTSLCVPTTLPHVQYPKDIFGISVVVRPEGEQYFQLSKELGATWMRTEFDWRGIERADGTYDWAQSDTTIAEMNARGFSALGNINYLPLHLHTWEDIRAHFKKFTRALAERYTPLGVNYYEIFNEPNLAGWGWLDKSTRPEPYIGEYAILLAIANAEIRAVNPEAVIVLGGISSDDVTGMPYVAFTKSLLDLGSANCFDIYAFHPYGKEGKFGKTAAELTALLSTYTPMYKPIWFNEYGTDQNDRLAYAIESMIKERSAADAWFWFTLRDLRPNNRWNFGLLNYEFKKKPAFDLLKELLSSR